MNLKFVLLWLFFAFSSIAAVQEVERELPRDRVLPLKAQEELFVRAYEEIDLTTIHPTKTIVPGLAPMVRMHYSYVRAFLETNAPDHLPALRHLWVQTSKAIEENQLTIGLMRVMAVQLAILLSEAQGTEEEGRYQDLRENGRWKDLSVLDDRIEGLYMNGFPALFVVNESNYETFGLSWNDFQKQPRQFRQGAGFCEAILCNPTGGFSYDRYVRNFLSRSFPLKISALPFNMKKGGVHGGNIWESTDFLGHEFTHTHEFASSIFDEEDRLKKHPEVLEQYPPIKEYGPWVVKRNILRKLYDSSHNPPRNKAAIFLMLHENHPSLLNFRPWLGEESLPFCERRLFWNLVANAINWPAHLEDFFLQWPHMTILSVPESPLSLSLKVENVKVESDHTRLEVRLDCQKGSYEDAHVGKPSLKQGIGTLTFSVAYPQSMVKVPYDAEGHFREEMGELEIISNISDIAWNDPEGILRSSQKEEFLKKMKTEYAQQGSRTYNTRDRDYRQFMMDDERKIRGIYGDALLPPETDTLEERALAMDKAMKKFWTDFYLENKELFSAESYISS